MQNDSLDNIREKVFSGYPFALSNEEKDIWDKLNTKSIPRVVSEYRQKLEYLGNRCAVFTFLKNDNDEHMVPDEDVRYIVDCIKEAIS